MKVTLGTVCRDRNSSKRQERPIQRPMVVLAPISGILWLTNWYLLLPQLKTKTVAIVEVNSQKDFMGLTIDRHNSLILGQIC